MNISIQDSEIHIVITPDETESWGNVWPYPQFSGKEIDVTYNEDGIKYLTVDEKQLAVSLLQNSYGKIGVVGRELAAMIKDHVLHLLTVQHPCYSVILNEQIQV